MSLTLPLFPLGSVLYPGLVMPLHIFEERYRQLVDDLLAGPEPRQFGVIAIRQGQETGVDGVTALFETGCTAVVRRVTRHPDGKFDLITVGAERFKLIRLVEPAPYFSAEIEMLPDEIGDEAEAESAVPVVQAAFRAYLDLLSERGGAQVSVPELPDEPILLSYLVAAAVVLDLPVRQQLLAEPNAAARLKTERALLTKEQQILRSLTATPAPDLLNSPFSQN
ncbi:MAG TPA: LON peptidase substrate-binding domain-containing protein [Streptosporangiaceae bacterium]|nr:LON peptidase substrate-binding domain-containing protein [Streptosporangiaceae bacterium]